MNKSKLPTSLLSHLILRNKTLNPNSPNLNHNRFLHNSSNPFQLNRILTKPTFSFSQTRSFKKVGSFKRVGSYKIGWFTEQEEGKALQELREQLEKEEFNEREVKRKAGVIVNDAEIEEEDYLGVQELIDKIDAELAKPKSKYFLDEATDSDGDSDDEEDDPVSARKAAVMFERLCKRHQELLQSFNSSGTVKQALNNMDKLNRFEDKHFHLRPEYRVIGELMNRFKDATGKEKFMLAMKLNRGMRMVEEREKFDPYDSSNYGVIQRPDDAIGEIQEEAGERPIIEDDGEEEFDDMKERDDILLEKVNAIDKKLEEKLAALDYTFGKKGKVLEEEIRDLAKERNDLTEKKNIPLYRIGFDVKMIDVNRTCKVTKGGRIFKYTVILACGNYNGVVGYSKAKGPSMQIARQKAYEKCFQNLHTIDRYEDHTIAHAIQTTYKKTKLYLWPAKTSTGVKAGKTIEIILQLAGFKNVKSKVIGSRNPHNTVKALFMALNSIETPKDVQEKFGRTVVESYLL